MPMKDECGICGRVLPYGYLRRCYRCGKLYCRDCMVPDVATGDSLRMLCLHCARRTVAPRAVSKYEGLKSYLKFRGSFTARVQLSLARVDGVIGENLPMDAYREEGWWSNSSSSLHARSWLEAGWEVEEVNLKEGFVVFKKVREPQTRRKARAEIKKPFTPVRVRSYKPKVPSKTKLSRLYARLQNVERQRSAMPIYRGSFKPKARHEKRLFKSREKPQ